MRLDRVNGADLLVLGAFLSRGFREWASNRTRVVLGTSLMMANVATWGIFAHVALQNPTYLNAVQTTAKTVVDFILIGQLTQMFFWMTQGSLTGLIMGRSFANLWTAPTRFPIIVIGGNAWRYVWVLFSATIYVLAGIVFFRMNFNITLSLVFVLLGGFLVMQSLELIAAGITVVTKSGQDPVNWFLQVTSTLVTGLYFPVQFLPKALQWVAAIHPQRYLLDLSRRSISQGLPLDQLLPEITKLLLTGATLLAVGLVVFRWGFNRARREGTIGHT